MTEDVKSIAKSLHNELADVIWQAIGVKERSGDAAALVAKHDDLLERYVQCRINMALIGGDIELQ